MKPTYKVVINWKHNSPALEFRFLDKEEAENLHKKFQKVLGNISYIDLKFRGNEYTIDVTGISYVEYTTDLAVEE